MKEEVEGSGEANGVLDSNSGSERSFSGQAADVPARLPGATVAFSR